MKRLGLLVALAGIVAAGIGARGHDPSADAWTVFVGGDTLGYLSPCGCTEPMSGGIRRRAEAVRQLATPGHTVVLENGGFVDGQGEQDRMKAETMAEALGAMDAAINLTSFEAKLGAGRLTSLVSLSGGRFVSASLASAPALDIPAARAAGPFLVGGATTQTDAVESALAVETRSPDAAADALTDQARQKGLAPVLLLEGTLDQASALAKAHPALRLIVYRWQGNPPEKPVHVGDTLLVTPGERSKYVVRLRYAGGRFDGYTPIDLGPEYPDDPHVARLYATYLKRVDQAGLLDQLPRRPSDPYAGTEKCETCHAEAARVWETSGHAHALQTLEKDGHGRDPDCVGCHVVGLADETGYHSRQATPALAEVGCESCHGAGERHAETPQAFKMPKVGEETCTKCHTPLNSPNFDFLTYWARIRHGSGKTGG